MPKHTSKNKALNIQSKVETVVIPEKEAKNITSSSNLLENDTTKEVIYLEASNLADFLEKVISKSKEGYKLDYEHNETYPVHFGWYFKLGMYRDV